MQFVHLCQRFRVLALRRVGTREIYVSLLEFRIHFQGLAQLLDRLRVIPLEKVRLADVAAGDEQSWIQLQRPLEGVSRFFEVAGEHEHIPDPFLRRRVIRIQLKSLPILGERRRPVILKTGDVPQCRMRLTQAGLQFQRAQRRLLRLGKHLGRAPIVVLDA